MNDYLVSSHKAIIELTNGRIVDVLNGSYLGKEASVLIKDGIIVSIPGSDTSRGLIKPDIAIDLMGKTLMPGFFNPHCHIQMINPTIFVNCKTQRAKKKFHSLQVDKNMEECLSRGITNIRDAYTEDLRPNQILVKRIQSGKLAGPRIQQAIVVGALGGYLCPDLSGIGKMISGLYVRDSIDFDDENSGIVTFPPDAGEKDIREKVDMAIDERGADLIKVAESLEESMINSNPAIMGLNQLSTITNQARKRGLSSTIHSVSVETFRRAVSAGFTTIAHVPRDGKLLPEDIEKCLKADILVDPTLSGGYEMSWRLKGDPFYNDPLIEKLSRYRDEVFAGFVNEYWIPELREFVMAGFNKANDSKYNMFGIVDLSKILIHFSSLPAYGFENARMLFEKGIRLSCANDGGIQSCTPAMIGNELALMDLAINRDGAEIKFNSSDAIRAATINGARSMGLDDKFGSIEVGKTADLVIIDGDPFDDPGMIGKPVDALFMDGELVINKIGLQAAKQNS